MEKITTIGLDFAKKGRRNLAMLVNSRLGWA